MHRMFLLLNIIIIVIATFVIGCIEGLMMKPIPWHVDATTSTSTSTTATAAPILKIDNSNNNNNVLLQKQPYYKTIHEIPTFEIYNQTELALVLLLDKQNSKILFQIPNTKLNWKYHFGCQLLSSIKLNNGKQQKQDDDLESTTAMMIKEIKEILQGHDISIQKPIRKAGMMLFTFPTMPNPMRVHVFEASVDSSSSSSSSSGNGVWFPFSDIPYTEMWSDDKYWLPWFLVVDENDQKGDEEEEVEYQGHFIFDGNPGPTSQLLAHNCKRIA